MKPPLAPPLREGCLRPHRTLPSGRGRSGWKPTCVTVTVSVRDRSPAEPQLVASVPVTQARPPRCTPRHDNASATCRHSDYAPWPGCGAQPWTTAVKRMHNSVYTTSILTGRGLMNFKDLRFGYAAAEKEAAQDPRLLLQGFFEPARLRSDVAEGPRFLILGAKGSGKTAVTEHLRLQYDASSGFFFQRIELDQFPFRDFATLDAGVRPARHGTRRPGVGYCLFNCFRHSKPIKGPKATAISNTVKRCRLWPEEVISQPPPYARSFCVLRRLESSLDCHLCLKGPTSRRTRRWESSFRRPCAPWNAYLPIFVRTVII